MKPLATSSLMSLTLALAVAAPALAAPVLSDPSAPAGGEAAFPPGWIVPTTPPKPPEDPVFTIKTPTCCGTRGLAPPTAPIPEPQSWMMLVSGFGLMGLTMRRSRMMTS